jgi:hypothetical protein
MQFQEPSMKQIGGIVCVLAMLASPLSAAELELRVVEDSTGEPTAARVHLKNAQGRTPTVKDAIAWKDHFVFNGKVILDLPPGKYTFEMERGPEYKLRTGDFELKRGDADNKEVRMVRFVDMKKEGWYSGETHIHRRPQDIETLMLAEDLHVAPVITWWNDRNEYKGKSPPEKLLHKLGEDRYYHLMGGEDERGGGALLYFQLEKPLEIAGAMREYPSPVKFLEEAKKSPGVHVDLEKPFWWDAPTWIATGKVDSIGLAHNHMWRDGVMNDEAWGRPRDKTLYPSNSGNGRWSTDIYYRVLNCGLRIPPSAGSASGVLPNPVGYNRVYAYCGDDFSYEKWWEGVRAGRVMVTNGPLLRPFCNEQPPGHVFKGEKGQPLELQITANLSTRDPIDYLEVIVNGKPVHEVRLDQLAEARGELPKLKFEESGWFLVRAVTTEPKTYRFASSGPWYVEFDGQPRVSKESAEFFVDWVNQRARNLELADAEQKNEVLEFHRRARDYWKSLADKSTAP